MPAEGWYEWQQIERVDQQTGEILKVKQPHFIHRAGSACQVGKIAMMDS